MNNLKILKAKPEDIEGIYQVRKITWLDTYPNKDFGITKKNIEEKFIEIEKNFNQYLEERKERLRKNLPNSKTWITKFNNQIVGFCMTEKGQKNKIGAIYILPQFPRKGIGKKLMKKALKWLGKDKRFG